MKSVLIFLLVSLSFMQCKVLKEPTAKVVSAALPNPTLEEENGNGV